MDHPFIKRLFQVPRSEIGFLRFIFEGYDGLVFLRTLDGRTGLVEISYAPSRKREAEELLDALAREVSFENGTDTGEP